MEIQQLRYVVNLALEQHFARAAQRSYVTQPTLSQQVKKLEEELGVVLFERSSQGVRLTAAGKDFLPHAQSVLDQVAAAKEAVEDGPIRGRIALGAIPTICPYWVPKLIQRKQKQLGEVQLALYEETTPVLLQSLKNGRLDFAVMALPVGDATLSSVSLGKEAFWVVLPANHVLSDRSQLTLQDIQAERMLILQEGHCFGDQSVSFCGKQRSDDQVVFLGSSLTSVLELTAAGEGITFAPHMAVRPRKDLVFIPFAEPKPYREIGLVWRKSAALTKAQKALKALIMKLTVT